MLGIDRPYKCIHEIKHVKKLITKVAGTQKGKQKSTIRHMEAGVRRSNRTIHYSYLHYNLDNLYNYAEQK